MEFLIERSSSSEHRDSITEANPTVAFSPAKKEINETGEKISRSLKREKSAPKLSLPFQGDTAVSMDSSAAALQYDFVKESEKRRKTLKQQRSISEGVLEKQVSESQDRSSAHRSRRSSATADTAAPMVGGTSRHRMHGNPLTESLDAALSGKKLAGANHFISEKREDNITERKDTSRLSSKPHPGKQSYTSHRKGPAFFSSRDQSATTAIGLGARLQDTTNSSLEARLIWRPLWNWKHQKKYPHHLNNVSRVRVGLWKTRISCKMRDHL